ncbi:MAG: hypothetical protein Q4D02_01395 [Clostridia bacterium]|nr:hypothetical protein [Clostridia bacterium]
MKRTEIIEELKKYDFDEKEYLVISSAALVIHGIKEETKDIDISVTRKYYQYLEEHYECELERYDDKNHVNIYYIHGIINFSTNYYSEDIDDFVMIDGIRVQSIPAIIRLKQMLNRPKDLRDLELIEKFLNRKIPRNIT